MDFFLFDILAQICSSVLGKSGDAKWAPSLFPAQGAQCVHAYACVCTCVCTCARVCEWPQNSYPCSDHVPPCISPSETGKGRYSLSCPLAGMLPIGGLQQSSWPHDTHPALGCSCLWAHLPHLTDSPKENRIQLSLVFLHSWHGRCSTHTP